MQAEHSRDFEREADACSFEWLDIKKSPAAARRFYSNASKKDVAAVTG